MYLDTRKRNCGKPDHKKMVYDEDYANLVSVLENVVRTHDNGKMQLRIVRPDGKTRWVESGAVFWHITM